MEKKTENQINIELNEEVASGIYSNLAIITHSNAEFVCDFVQMLPGMPKAQVKSRIIMTPQNAKRLMRALIENVQKYEQNMGLINDNDLPGAPPMNFGTPTTQA
jgi:mannose/fructose-specific phosphotransferase system component IIA